ncbi:MAG TPA: GlsB/YeaQ/YmgE family stress response membrane protein [Acidimicrobiia bacterium]|nr:GlsB/YeaQ/YmgE family stress response membrane protein [Acidimicrobiia bacterium]
MSIGEIIGYFIVGAIVGPLARLLVPGKDPMGVVQTIVAGAVGALLGGLVFSGWITPDNQGVPWIASIIGAVLVVLVLRLVRRSSATST